MTAVRADSAVLCRRYFGERELASYSGLSIRTLQAWRLRNQGPPWRKFGGGVRYDLQAFDAWAAAQPGGGGGVGL